MNSPESFKLTEQRVANYNENHGKKLAEFRQRPDGNYFVVLLDPLILHVHEVNISKMVYNYSSRSVHTFTTFTGDVLKIFSTLSTRTCTHMSYLA